jgi:hypothetical protein
MNPAGKVRCNGARGRETDFVHGTAVYTDARGVVGLIE